MGRTRATLILLILCCTAASAHERPGAGAVVSARPEATAAGMAMLKAGGNAFDAAAAVALALGVVEPGSSGIGGGGFFLIHLADEGRDLVIDARETAPQLAGDGAIYRRRSSIDGPQAAGVPGLLAGIERLRSRYGRLSRAAIARPAIRLAEEGFSPGARLQRMIRWRAKAMNPAARARFVGLRRIRLPALAEVLRRYAAIGTDDFYRGQTAGRLVADMKHDGGLIRAADLAAYRVVERRPVAFDWHGYRIVSAPLPSSGGLTLKMILGMVAGDDLAAMSRADRVHLLVEAMKRAYGARNRYMGDPAFVTPPDGLTAQERLAALRHTISMAHATPAAAVGAMLEPAGNGRDTTHFSVIDRDGNMVSATLSINYPFGSGYLSPSTGILLNDEMDDFATRPGRPNAYGLVQGAANAVAPGKRMLSSMSPTIIHGPERTLILGTPGGSRIISMVLLAGLRFMLHEGSPQQWIDRGRFHHQLWPDRIEYEQGALTPATIAELTRRGHRLRQIRDYGNMEAILWLRRSGEVVPLADRRGEGRGTTTSSFAPGGDATRRLDAAEAPPIFRR
ncbi:MAG: gamma-glutamyltransferase [Zetaproteobacteria bacterium]|nr:MAG: gamma-glutamyltransferase [Zetaproteobacteria bacterium]